MNSRASQKLHNTGKDVMKTNQDSIQDAAGYLGAMPSRAGMTAIGNLKAMERYTADGKAIVFDVGTSANLTSHQLMMCSTRTGMSQPHVDVELLAKTVQLGVLGGGRWLAEPKVGVRKPLSLDRKAKARKATKAAAKSRRRNRQ